MRHCNLSKSISLINCHLFSGNERDDLLKDAVIIFNHPKGKSKPVGRILYIGRLHEAGELIRDSEKIDLDGKYVIPGLINAHCHLFGDGRPKNAAANEWMVSLFLSAVKSWPFRFFFEHMIKRNLKNALHAGVTTIRTLGDPFYIDIILKRKFEWEDEAWPRIIGAGMGIGVTGGHAAILSTQCDNPWEARKAVRKNIREGADLIKIFSTGGAADSRRRGEAGRLQMTPEEIAAACDEAHRAGFTVASHVLSTEGVYEALMGGVDTIEHGALLTDKIIDLFKKNPKALNGQSTLIPTISPVLHLSEARREVSKISPAMKENIDAVRNGVIGGLKKALQEGVEIGIGSDAAMPLVTHYDFWRELYYISKYGEISPLKVISLATSANARIMGIDHQTGSLEVGKSADLVAFKRNPLEDITALAQPDFVVIGGKIISNPKIRRFPEVEEALNPLL